MSLLLRLRMILVAPSRQEGTKASLIGRLTVRAPADPQKGTKAGAKRR